MPSTSMRRRTLRSTPTAILSHHSRLARSRCHAPTTSSGCAATSSSILPIDARGTDRPRSQNWKTRARDLGRRTLIVNANEDQGDLGKGPSRHFAPLNGYHVIEENVIRDLAWPRPEGALDELDRRCYEPSASDYEILSWRNAAPSELRSGLARVKAVMPVEVPDAGYGAEEEVWDDARVINHEERVDQMGRDLLAAAARHRRTGEIVGFSELTVSRERPGTAYQWDTLVVRAHRGHHLGALLKIATMRLLESGGYATHVIFTSNNSLNPAMIAVNEALGARIAGAMVAWRKDL